jgi:hypothetical protein
MDRQPLNPPLAELEQDETRLIRADELGAGPFGFNVRNLAGMHDVSQTVLAEYIGSRKQTIGPILTGKKPAGRDLQERFAAAFYVPVFILQNPSSRLALAAGLLTMNRAPIRAFTATGATDRNLMLAQAERARRDFASMMENLGDASDLLARASDIAGQHI